MTKTWNASDVVVSDIEGNNLLYKITQLHCGVVLNPFTLEENSYVEQQRPAYLAKLDESQVVVGHNFRGFDLLALDKLFGYRYHGFCFDTLVLSRLLNPERKAHSLESWGITLGFRKGDYKVEFIRKAREAGRLYTPGDEWLNFSQDMLDYCVQDVRLNAALFLWMIHRLGWCEWFGSNPKEVKRLGLAITSGDIK